MTAPTPSVQDVVNDPNFTPLAASSSGDVLVTEDGTVIIVTSTLRSRGTHILSKRKWLRFPPAQQRVL